MNQNLLSFTHGQLDWNDSFPHDFKGVRLPGSTISTSIGEFGSVCIQEYITKDFSIRFNVFDLLQRFVVKTFFASEFKLYSKFVLKGRIDYQLNDNRSLALRHNQFILSDSERSSLPQVYEKNIHISFDAFFTRNFAKQLLELFPNFKLQSDEAKWADTETTDIVNSMLRSKYEKDLHRHYFESRVRDLLFKYLFLAEISHPELKKVTEEDLKAISKVEELISDDITVHYTIPELAKKVLLNEFRLKFLFKNVFGVGPYEYLIRKRLHKAKELLESGLSVKETAAKVGYRPTDFTTAFRNHFGLPPSSAKRKP